MHTAKHTDGHEEESYALRATIGALPPELLMPREASRTFDLLTPTFSGHMHFSMDWPEPSRNAYLQTNLYTYYQPYVLICPGCGTLWCRASCSRPPDAIWSIRARWCEHCMQGYFKWYSRMYEGRLIPSQHCPGTILSFDDKLLHEGADHDTWEACFWALPEPWRTRELQLWCQFDSLCNPTPTETAHGKP